MDTLVTRNLLEQRLTPLHTAFLSYNFDRTLHSRDFPDFIGEATTFRGCPPENSGKKSQIVIFTILHARLVSEI